MSKKRFEKETEYWNRYSVKELALMEGAVTDPDFWDTYKTQRELDKQELDTLRKNRINYMDGAAMDMARAANPKLSVDDAQKVVTMAKSQMEMAKITDELYDRKVKRSSDKAALIGGIATGAIATGVSVFNAIKSGIPIPIDIMKNKRR